MGQGATREIAWEMFHIRPKKVGLNQFAELIATRYTASCLDGLKRELDKLEELIYLIRFVNSWELE